MSAFDPKRTLVNPIARAGMQSFSTTSHQQLEDENV